MCLYAEVEPWHLKPVKWGPIGGCETHPWPDTWAARWRHPFALFKLLSKRVISFSQEAFTKNKLIKREIKQMLTISNFLYPFPTILYFWCSTKYQYLLNFGKLRCALVCNLFTRVKTTVVLKEENYCLKFWELYPFTKLL